MTFVNLEYFKNLYKFCILFMACILLSACAGSAYKLPLVTPEEVAKTQTEIDTDQSELKIYKRSDTIYKKKIATIANRLEGKAKPLCEQSEYPSCYFQVKYDNENTVNAFASENYKITVYKGLLQYLKNDDEIAAVVAHEMGHHLAHHNEETAQNAATGAAIAGIVTAVLLAAANSNNTYYTPYQQQQNDNTIHDMMMAGAGIGAISYSKE